MVDVNICQREAGRKAGPSCIDHLWIDPRHVRTGITNQLSTQFSVRGMVEKNDKVMGLPQGLVGCIPPRHIDSIIVNGKFIQVTVVILIKLHRLRRPVVDMLPFTILGIVCIS